MSEAFDFSAEQLREPTIAEQAKSRLNAVQANHADRLDQCGLTYKAYERLHSFQRVQVDQRPHQVMVGRLALGQPKADGTGREHYAVFFRTYHALNTSPQIHAEMVHAVVCERMAGVSLPAEGFTDDEVGVVHSMIAELEDMQSKELFELNGTLTGLREPF